MIFADTAFDFACYAALCFATCKGSKGKIQFTKLKESLMFSDLN